MRKFVRIWSHFQHNYHKSSSYLSCPQRNNLVSLLQTQPGGSIACPRRFTGHHPTRSYSPFLTKLNDLSSSFPRTTFGTCQLIMASNSAALPSNDSVLPEPIVTRISASIERHDYYPKDENRPTLLLLSWLKATPRALDRFRHFYASHGFNVVTVTSKPIHFIWPKSAKPLAQEICGYIISNTHGPIIVHGLSIGGYIYANCLMYAQEKQQVFEALESRIKGHIFDSLVAGNLENMAEGVSKGSADYPSARYVVQKLILMYFWLARNHTIPFYDRGIEAFYNLPFRSPVLMYYSKIDTMCSNDVMEDLEKTWREKRSVDVTVKVFDDSEHVFHMRKYPEEYKAVLGKFLNNVKLSNQAVVNSKL